MLLSGEQVPKGPTHPIPSYTMPHHPNPLHRWWRSALDKQAGTKRRLDWVALPLEEKVAKATKKWSVWKSNQVIVTSLSGRRSHQLWSHVFNGNCCSMVCRPWQYLPNVNAKSRRCNAAELWRNRKNKPRKRAQEIGDTNCECSLGKGLRKSWRVLKDYSI